jgi:hypothetical protein
MAVAVGGGLGVNIQPQVRLARFRVRPVALETGVAQDGADVALEGHFSRVRGKAQYRDRQ